MNNHDVREARPLTLAKPNVPVTNETLKRMKLDDDGPFAGLSKGAIIDGHKNFRNYFPPEWLPADDKKHTSPVHSYSKWCTFLLVNALYYYLGVGVNELFITKENVEHFCNFIARIIFPDYDTTLDTTKRIEIAKYLIRVINNSIRATKGEFKNLGIRVGGTRNSIARSNLAGVDQGGIGIVHASLLVGDPFRLTGYACDLIEQVKQQAALSRVNDMGDRQITIEVSMVDDVASRLDQLLTSHNVGVPPAEHVFSSKICADMVLYIRKLLATKKGLKTIYYPVYTNQETLKVTGLIRNETELEVTLKHRPRYARR